MRLSGVYTALASNSARAQYEASIDAYVTTLTTALGGTWELVEESSASADDTDKLLEFTRLYRELIFAQSSAATDDAQIVGQRLFISRTKLFPGDAAGKNAQRLIELEVSYEASIDKTNTNLESKWDDAIRGYVMSKVQDVAGTGSLAITSEEPRFDKDENRITATMTVLARAGSDILQMSLEAVYDEDKGFVPVPVWDGGIHSKYMLQGAAMYTRRVTERVRKFGGPPLSASSGKAGNASDPGSVDLFGIGSSFMGGVQSGLAGQLGQFGIGAMGKESLGKLNITYPGGGGGGSGGTGDAHASTADGSGYHTIRVTRTTEPIEIGPIDYRITVTEETTVTISILATLPPVGAGATSATGGNVSTINQNKDKE
jgi:hypothetical protein